MSRLDSLEAKLDRFVSTFNPSQTTGDGVLMSRLDSLEAKFDRFVSTNDPGRLIDQVCRASCQAVFGATREMEEINSKKLNLVFLNVPVEEGGDDLATVRDSLETINGLSGDMIVSVWRDAASVRPGVDKPPILKVRVKSTGDKSKILDAAMTKAFHPFYVRKDLTYNERVMRRQAARLRTNNGAYTATVAPALRVNGAGDVGNFVGGGGQGGRVVNGPDGTGGVRGGGSVGGAPLGARGRGSPGAAGPPF